MQRKQTSYWRVDAQHPRRSTLLPAVEALRCGGVVAFPTETVYGLGADALNSQAVYRIFAAKGRPADNPLIVHVSSLHMARELMAPSAATDAVELAMRTFWPGPLTLVVPRANHVPSVVTGGLNTVGLRMPSHPISLQLIELFNKPIAAPSANRSGKPSPTTANHVLEDLEGRIDGIIDGGPCTVGVESTVVDMTAWPPVVLRPGGITMDDLQRTLHCRVTLASSAEKANEPVRSPGMKYVHYAPNTPLVLIEGEEITAEDFVNAAVEYKQQGKRVGLLLTDERARDIPEFPTIRMGPRTEPERIANSLFATLRYLDTQGFDVVLVEGIKPSGMGLAVMNRLRRAAEARVFD